MEKSVGRVMVVDDDAAICDLLKSALELEGFAVDVCENDSDVSIALAKFRPDAVLMDASMPGLDGITLCRHLKQSPETSSIPVIIVSAFDDDKTRHDAALFGADDFVAKPFDVKKLTEKIKKIAGCPK